MEQWSLEMKYKLLILLLIIFGGHCYNLYRNNDIVLPEPETFEIKDRVTGNIHIFKKATHLRRFFILKNLKFYLKTLYLKINCEF